MLTRYRETLKRRIELFLNMFKFKNNICGTNQEKLFNSTKKFSIRIECSICYEWVIWITMIIGFSDLKRSFRNICIFLRLQIEKFDYIQQFINIPLPVHTITKAIKSKIIGLGWIQCRLFDLLTFPNGTLSNSSTATYTLIP